MAAGILGLSLPLVSACASGNVGASKAPSAPPKTESPGGMTLGKNPYAAMFPGAPTYALRPQSDVEFQGPVEVIKRALGRGEDASPPAHPETPPSLPSPPPAQDLGVFDYTGAIRELAHAIEAALPSTDGARQGKIGLGILRFINKTGVALDMDGLTRALTFYFGHAGRYELLDAGLVNRLLSESGVNPEVLIEKQSFGDLAGKAETDFLLVSSIWGNQTKRVLQSRLISLQDGRVRQELVVPVR